TGWGPRSCWSRSSAWWACARAACSYLRWCCWQRRRCGGGGGGGGSGSRGYPLSVVRYPLSVIRYPLGYALFCWPAAAAPEWPRPYPCRCALGCKGTARSEAAAAVYARRTTHNG